MIRLRVKAPFAAFRYFTAGNYRPTAPFVTPSAAYGLLLNVAGIEMRFDDGKSPMTLMRRDLPGLELALGLIRKPDVHSIYQQLHNYPVGATGKSRAPDCKGNKYNIQPVRREFLSGIDAVVCVRGNDDVERRVRAGLRGEDTGPNRRYGLPFLGDNSFLIDVIREEEPGTAPAQWLTPAPRGASPHPDEAARLTLLVYRADMTRTKSAVFLLTESTADPPDSAWLALP